MRAGLFIRCSIGTVYPEVDTTTLELLERVEVKVGFLLD